MQYAYAAGRRRFPNYAGEKDNPLISPFTMSATKSLMRNNVVLSDTLIPASDMMFRVYILDFTLPIYVNPSSLTTLSDAYKSRARVPFSKIETPSTLNRKKVHDSLPLVRFKHFFRLKHANEMRHSSLNTNKKQNIPHEHRNTNHQNAKTVTDHNSVDKIADVTSSLPYSFSPICWKQVYRLQTLFPSSSKNGARR